MRNYYQDIKVGDKLVKVNDVHIAEGAGPAEILKLILSPQQGKALNLTMRRGKPMYTRNRTVYSRE